MFWHTQGNLGIYFERMVDVKPDDYQELFRQSLEKHVESKLHYEQKSSYDCLNDLLNIGVCISGRVSMIRNFINMP